MKIATVIDVWGRTEGYKIVPHGSSGLSVRVELNDARAASRETGVPEVDRPPTIAWYAMSGAGDEQADALIHALAAARAFAAAHAVRREERAAGTRDGCEVCLGDRKGVVGNENRVGPPGLYVLMCDYCHAEAKS